MKSVEIQPITGTNLNNSRDAIFRAYDADDGKVTLNNVSWFTPFVKPALKEENELYKIIERKESLAVGYRMIQCDSITVSQAASFSWMLTTKSSPKVPRLIIVDVATTGKIHLYLII